MSDGYKSLMDVWPPPSEATRARLQRLQELEEQRRERIANVQQRQRSSSLDRGASSSRELLLGSRGHLNRSSFRSSGRRLAYQTPVVSSSAVDERFRALRRSTSEQIPGQDNASSNNTNQSSDNITSSASVSNISNVSNASEGTECTNPTSVSEKENNLNVNEKQNKSEQNKEISRVGIETVSVPDSSAVDTETVIDNQTQSGPEKSIGADGNDVGIDSLQNDGTEASACTADSASNLVDASYDASSVESVRGNSSSKTEADTEIEITGQPWSVSEDTDKKLQDIMSQKEARLVKLKELENLRLQGRIQEPEDMGMSARERFNLNYNSAVRAPRQLSLREQIRRERRLRRHSDLQLSNTSTFGTDQTGSNSSLSSTDETPSGTSGERTTRAMNPNAWDAAFSDGRDERMKRMKELDRMRKEGKREGSSFDSDRSVLTRDSFQSGYEYSSSSMFPLSSARSTESILSSRRPFELPLQFSSISEQREPSLFSSTSRLERVSSTQDVLARARETLANLPARRTEITVETDEISQQTENQTEASVEESDEVPVYVEGTPQGVPYVDDAGRTHWVDPTSPKYNEVVTQTRRTGMDPLSTVMSMRDSESDPIRARQRNRGLPPEIQDHYLAECFDPKYTLKERIVLIRKKLWGDPPQIPSFDRGKPDGAPIRDGTSSSEQSNTENATNNSEGTKTV